jgi:hypothetical protein
MEIRDTELLPFSTEHFVFMSAAYSLKIKLYKIIILHVVFLDVDLGLSHIGRAQIEGV